jgi:O-antigen ligase
VNRIALDAGNFDQIWTVRAAHSIYLGWLEQAGLLGAVPMFACVGSIVGLTIRNGFRRTRMSSLIFALLAADAVFLVHGATDFALEVYSMAALWAYLLGLQFSLSQGTSSR